jgi:hypothetical protein
MALKGSLPCSQEFANGPPSYKTQNQFDLEDSYIVILQLWNINNIACYTDTKWYKF